MKTSSFLVACSMCAAAANTTACSSSQEKAMAGATGAGPTDAGASSPGNVLVADQYNNRVIEITRQGSIVWTFGDGSSVPGATSIVAPNDAERLPDGRTLMAGTGTAAGTEPACAADGGGCPDNRVVLVDASKAIVWQYGQDGGMSGSGPDQLSSPVCAVMLPSGNVLITDQGNARIIEVTMSKAIAWQYPGPDAGAAQQLNNPNSAERLANGDTLIADENNNRVIEVDAAGNIVWQYPQDADAGLLNGVAFASRLPNGNTLITDSNDNRIVEVTPAYGVAWSYVTSGRAGSNKAPLPTRAVRLANGNTLISDQFNHQVIEVDSSGSIVFTYGQLNSPGNAAGQLNGPYDAKVVGDFTGLTPPQ
jgi:hypothetical protein